uniref:Fatty acid amide hydrolase 2 n=1 Tax=Cairina moschata TaxID=8855 RepID=A0A8C3B797_CAIMO
MSTGVYQSPMEVAVYQLHNFSISFFSSLLGGDVVSVKLDNSASGASVVAIDNKIEQAMVSRSPPSPPGGVQGGGPVLWVGVSPGAGGPPSSPACCWAEQLLCLPAAAGRAHWLRLRRSAQGKKGGGMDGGHGKDPPGVCGGQAASPGCWGLAACRPPPGEGGDGCRCLWRWGDGDPGLGGTRVQGMRWGDVGWGWGSSPWGKVLGSHPPGHGRDGSRSFPLAGPCEKPSDVCGAGGGGGAEGANQGTVGEKLPAGA